MSTASEVDTELTEKYLVKGKSVPRRAGSIEQKFVLAVQNPDNLPSDDAIISKIKETPRSSMMLMMGMNGLQENADILRSNEAKWESNMNQHKQLRDQFLAEEQQLQRVRLDAYARLQIAQKEYHDLDIKFSCIQSLRSNHDEQCRRYERRAKVARKLITLIDHLTSEGYEP